MQLRRVFAFSIVAGWSFTACNQPPAPVPVAAATNSPTLYQGEPLRNLRTLKLWLGNKELTTQLAIAPHELATGMMHRREMGEDESMFFVLPFPQRASFYMKNTHVPLSCAYIDPDGVILEIHDLKPLDETPVYSKSDRVQYVLETRQGWFQRNQIAVGAVIRTEYGALRETFRRR